jgi:hypothetical protein
MITSLLTEDGRRGARVVGATGVSMETGEFYMFNAKSVIITSGYACTMWTYSTEITGNSYRWDPNDIGDGLAPQNHDEFAAAIIRPYMREEVVWSVQHHAAFQMVYYAHHYGWNQYERDKFRDSPYYPSCVDFCEYWDQASFDPDYDTLPLEFFEPMVREVFARAPYKPETVQPGVRMPLRDEAVAAARAA